MDSGPDRINPGLKIKRLASGAASAATKAAGLQIGAEIGKPAVHPQSDADDDENRGAGDNADQDGIFDHSSAVIVVAELPGHRHELLHANFSLWRFEPDETSQG
ncbi:hypothetical protein BQ8482_190022 [Mesorhizobium delmotii]|uniref:Uncharacterized protein n=1 Tax=Mesorhizobium delmotii TaxID=1631247 RepID=A0A2P9AJH1_9HYPH|nr:hypothetical protein BQ8482_190022 [Mesorhizobium delmotii]